MLFNYGNLRIEMATGTPTNGPDDAALSSDSGTEEVRLEQFQYDDGIVRLFATATIVWGIVATLVGPIVAVLLVLAHQRRHLCIRRQRHFRRGLLQHTTTLQSSHVERRSQSPALLGLATRHCSSGHHASFGNHPKP